MSTRVLGLGPSLKRVVLSSRSRPILPWKNQIAIQTTFSRRALQIQSLPPSAAEKILNKQRLLRLSSPDLTIYQPQLTSIGSIAGRFTGGALSALLYGFSIAYLVAPGTFDSIHVAEFVAGLPDFAKYAGKVVLAAPFAYHSLNGLRHLSWDMGKFLSLKAVYGTGYVVLGATAISTIALVLK